MMPSQTSEVLAGAAVAFLYVGAVMAIGILSLSLSLGRQRSATVRDRLGLGGFLWAGFVMGQGIQGTVWLVLSLAGTLYSRFIWIVCALGWSLCCVLLVILRQHALQAVRLNCSGLSSLLVSRSWYFWLGVGVVVAGLLCGVTALLPPDNWDAAWYLTVANVIAFAQRLEFQPFTTPHNGLYPLQVEMHWAALFAISNETAVTVWDYLCAMSFLGGIGYLTWSLTSNRRAALLSILMMFSTPGFYNLIGAGKADNAAAQYGIAAFLWVALLPALGRRSVLMAGLCAGWMMASRYNNVIVVPALMLFAIMAARWSPRIFGIDTTIKSWKDWAAHALVGVTGAALAGAPMLLKNWLLVGCPLAPHFGCQETFWAQWYNAGWSGNISGTDLFVYPFVWTFAYLDNSYGNISPLFIGFLPFFLAYRRFSTVRSASIVGLAGLVSLITWLLIEPLILFTRWLLIPLGLLAVPLSASVVAAEQSLRSVPTARRLMRCAVPTIVFFLLFEGRGAIHGIRYAAAVDRRASRYELLPWAGYDVAAWLNAHVEPGQRVALYAWGGYKYLVSPHILLNSEPTEELQWHWERRNSLSRANLWYLYPRLNFTYVVLPKDRVADAVAVWPDDSAKKRLQVVFVGGNDAVVKIEKN